MSGRCILRDMGLGVEIKIEQEGDVYLVILEGRIDATSTPLVEKKLANLLDVTKKIAVDFTDIIYLSSAGMRLLLSMTKKMHAKSGEVVFFGMSDDVTDIIRMAGFERILKIYSSKSEALKAMK